MNPAISRAVAALALGAPTASFGDSSITRFPPVPPAEAAGTFELHAGLRLELVAAEPLVASPVAISFDENGRLYVVEMTDYPDHRHLGRIRLLESSRGDGNFDRSTVFAEGLSWPAGIMCYGGGVFVSCPPDILFLKDTHGDGKADIRRRVFTGFGNTVTLIHPDMQMNGFVWGLDNRVYGATSLNGGIVSPVDVAGAEPLDLRGKDFSFDPRAAQPALREESGTVQFGITFDDFGRRFVCGNSNHLVMVMYDYRYAARNPLVELPRALFDIPPDPPAARVFRLSPEESWRVLRTHQRVAGIYPGDTEGGHSSGYFTSACSVTVYRGAALPPAFYGNVFVAEPANNLVHRKILLPDGVAFQGFRDPAEKETEFLRSRDVWSRPVNLANGPDGALYVVDMYREMIEDPFAIPPDILKHYEIGAGRDRGRIYRVVGEGFRQPAWPRLGSAKTQDLVALLESPNGWTRDTASRLIYERRDRSCTGLLAKMARSSTLPAARVRALWALQGLGKLTDVCAVTAMGDESADVREQGVRLAEYLLGGGARAAGAALRARLVSMAGDPAIRVRYQAAFSLGELAQGRDATEALFHILLRDMDNSWVRAAVLSSVREDVGGFLALAGASPAMNSRVGTDFVGRLLELMGARGRRPEMTEAVLFLASIGDSGLRLTLFNDFSLGLRKAGVALRAADPDGSLSGTLRSAAGVAADPNAADEIRVSAVQLIAQDSATVPDSVLLALLDPREPQRIQIEAVAALGGSEGNPAAELVRHWTGFTPGVRQEAMRVLMSHPERTMVLLAAIRDNVIRSSDLTANQAQILHNHPDARVREEAARVLAQTNANRQKVIDSYAVALTLPADAAHGKKVFGAICAACHLLEGVGSELGPNLLGVKAHGKDSIMVDILDPNRKIDPEFLFYQIKTKAGDLLGAVADETPTSITVKQAWGSRTVVPRSEIVRMQSIGQSMMPDGLENAVSKQDMADLLEYLVGVR